MATEELPEQQEDITDLAPVESPGPVAPQGISEEETKEINERAADLVKQLEGASGSQELELIDSMTNLGIQAQRTAASELGLMRTRIGDMVTDEGPGAELAKDLVELRLVLNQINPHEMGDQGLLRRLFGMIPIIGKFSPALQIIERIAIRYESVSKQVSVIESRLREGPPLKPPAEARSATRVTQMTLLQLPSCDPPRQRCRPR